MGAVCASTGSGRWRERWHGSEPQKGSAIVDDRGNLIVYLGGDEETHRLTTAIVAAHNADLSRAASAPDSDKLRKALLLLEHCASEVHRLGAVHGTQWFRLSGALIEARSALSEEQVYTLWLAGDETLNISREQYLRFQARSDLEIKERSL